MGGQIKKEVGTIESERIEAFLQFLKYCKDKEEAKKTREAIREQATIRLPAELMEQLRQEAEEKGYTTNDLIMFILWDFLKNAVPK